MDFRACLRSPAVAIACLALTVVGAGAAGYLTSPDGDSQQVRDSRTEPTYLRGVIKDFTAGKITLTTAAGDQELTLASGAGIEALQPAALSAVRVGDWLNAGAVQHDQTLFALTGLVIIGPESLQQ